MAHTQNSWAQLYRGVKYALTQKLAGLVDPAHIQSDHPDPASTEAAGGVPYVVLFFGPAVKQARGLAQGGGRTTWFQAASGAPTQVFLTDKGAYSRQCTLIVYTFGFDRKITAGRIATRILTSLPFTTLILLPDDEESAGGDWTPARSQARLSASLVQAGPPFQVNSDETRLITQTQVPYQVQYSEYAVEETVLTTGMAIDEHISPTQVVADPFVL